MNTPARGSNHFRTRTRFRARRRWPGPGPGPPLIALVVAALVPAGVAAADLRGHAVGVAGGDVGAAEATGALGTWQSGGLSAPACFVSPGEDAPLRDETLTPWAGYVPLRDWCSQGAALAPRELAAEAVDLLRGRLQALMRSLEMLDRRLESVQTRLRATGEAGPEETGDEEAAAPPAPSAAEPIEPFRFEGGIVAAPASAAVGLEPAPFDAGAPAAPASRFSGAAHHAPSARLIEIFLQVAAITFLAAVLLVPFGCWIAAAPVVGRTRSA